MRMLVDGSGKASTLETPLAAKDAKIAPLEVVSSNINTSLLSMTRRRVVMRSGLYQSGIAISHMRGFV